MTEILDALADISPRIAAKEDQAVSNTKIQLRLPADMKAAVVRQAAASGISVNLYVATAVAARVGVQDEAERYFAARGSRMRPARAKALLSRLGTEGAVRDDDRLDAPDDGEPTSSKL